MNVNYKYLKLTFDLNCPKNGKLFNKLVNSFFKVKRKIIFFHKLLKYCKKEYIIVTIVNQIFETYSCIHS